MKKFFNIGPGTWVTAAFIGPGTVTVCTLAGVQFGFSLLWALVLSIVACVVLQEMAARLGVVTQKGLSEVLKSQFDNKIVRGALIALILSAIFIGNAAYEAGNISGGVLGLSTILESSLGISENYLSIVIGVIAFVLLYIGNYKVLERSLIVLVLLMSVAFIVTAIVTKPDISMIFKGFVPNFSSDNVLTIVGLIGTTVVPYNLFLHASIVSEKWKSTEDLPEAKKDTVVAIVLGGFVSMAIIIAGAAIQEAEVNNAADLAKGLEPVFGSMAKYVLSVGLFAAGITSAITAPLAAAYVVKGCMGWQKGLKSKSFRAVWMFILFLGVLFSSLGIKSIVIIRFAQIANGLLLPVIAIFLLWVMNQQKILGKYTNSWKQNLIGFFILIITCFLGFRGIWKVIESL
ncbi:NRAMP (natural resistance-associated macrophage protein)-like metal ion transporter [Aquimarina sp. EL_43]|uniref:Nramp family divalent metal transporter n=1 Tax=unclassified Aquimarina TaxID=2627091 RepID=UPI0018C9EFE0|nr:MULTISPECIES: Nramp family divalent metal transporter [unclassified Aquimarina]MBG6132228.1 NRAMP (natural resistance-associated macrophage protein)-like metal ion transporter [Aquimarina sp. EL_35]MBG6153025.1 NRAMP (natural resistance-associated macrophage protein)-like metal ion transporter [Aquimarina sp. EL_32]MBG6171032.1 NRAMP (natural resistance-associated macrophage protein)-like metal ion transporter [Aquimarina sp. EL_43]